MFTSSTSSVCTAGGTNGATIAVVAAGTCVISANRPRNAIYDAAPTVTCSVHVS